MYRPEKTIAHIFGRLLCLTIFFAASALHASGDLHSSVAVKRHVLALYDSRVFGHINETPVHENLEMVLNHLGCIVDYHDLQQGLPADEDMARYHAVIAWFEANAFDDPDAYLRWITRQVASGVKLIILGQPADFRQRETGAPATPELVQRYFETLQVKIQSERWTDNLARIEVRFKNPTLVEFERSLQHELSYYIRILPQHPDTEIGLSLGLRGEPDSDSAVIFDSPRVAMAISPYIIYVEPNTFRRKWRIDPFAFFEKALGLQQIPRPDITTLNGSRIWFSHIDGDALISTSQLASGRYCGEVIRDSVLQRYRWPVTVSVVVAELLQKPQFQNIARSIFALPYVEPASHTFSHPFYWDDNYSDKEKYSTRHLAVPGYRFDARHEVIGSISWIDKLLPPGKKVRLLLWSGNCEPTPEALQACAEIGALNMNGGDTIFDGILNSYAHVAPLSIPVGNYRQIYTANANENIYTNEWHGPFDGYRAVLDSYERTEHPRRIRPINVYYHFYMGEKWASLNTLHQVLRSTTQTEVAPVFASEYVEKVLGFFQARIARLSPDGWLLTEYGSCRTFRIDGTQRFPDLQRSRNVIGFLHYQGNLYVHLGEDDSAELWLQDSAPEQVYLHKASHALSLLELGRDRLQFSTHGFGTGFFVFANLAPGQRWLVRSGERTWYAASDSNGLLRIEAEMAGRQEQRFIITAE